MINCFSLGGDLQKHSAVLYFGDGYFCGHEYVTEDLTRCTVLKL